MRLTISELGSLVAGAFASPDRVGHGEHLSLAGDTMSWNEVAATLRDLGWNVAARRVPAEAYDGFYYGVREMRNMMQYWEAHTYFGPDAAKKIGLAREVATESPTPFATWAKANLPAPA